MPWTKSSDAGRLGADGSTRSSKRSPIRSTAFYSWPDPPVFSSRASAARRGRGSRAGARGGGRRARSSPDEVEELAGVAGEPEHHVLDRHLLDLRHLFGHARREPGATLDALELAPIPPRPVALHEQRAERKPLDHL